MSATLGDMVAAGTVGVDVLGGRVVWMNSSGELPAQTHQALAATQLRALMVASPSWCSRVTPIAPCSWCAMAVTGSTARPTA